MDSSEKIPFWRDERYLKIAFQVLVLLLVVGITQVCLGNMFNNLEQQGRQFNFTFLQSQSGFNIGETLVPCDTTSPYYWAFFVSFLNTLRLIIVGIATTTVVGIVAGIASFSDNWLLRKLNAIYVEGVRNTPLLLQLFVWYFAVFFGLSDKGKTSQLPGSIFVSKKGIVVPFPAMTPLLGLLLGFLLVGAIAAYLIWKRRITRMEAQGTSGKPEQRVLLSMAVVAVLVLFGLGWELPQMSAAGDVSGGLRVSVEYGAMLFGLVFYTGAFIAEIVRAGIQSVSKGQWEAARALGLPTRSTLQLVVLPQALRVILPSLNSQYMNLAKNSSLALAIGYPEIFSTAQTTLNQSGRPVEVILLISAIYLCMNLVITVVMNTLNRMVQFTER